MVQLLPLRDEAELKRLNEKEGLHAGLAYCLYNGGEVEGYLLYDRTPGEAVIQVVRAPDEASFDGLVRAAFNRLLDSAVNRARFDDRVDRPLLEKLEFVRPGECVTPSIEDVLYNCKHCRGE